MGDGHAQDGMGCVQFPAQCGHLLPGIKFRRSAGDDHHLHPVTDRDVAGDRAAAAEHLIVGMCRDYQNFHGFFREAPCA